MAATRRKCYVLLALLVTGGRALCSRGAPPKRQRRSLAVRRAAEAAVSECEVPAFCEPLWGSSDLDDATLFPPRPTSRKNNVECTVYEIGGALTSVLRKTCEKQLPLIPHVGVRVFGREYFYSDCIENRPAHVMADMLKGVPQVSFDLGPPAVTEAELERWLREVDGDWTSQSYDVFFHNCNHFAALLAAKVADPGLPPAIIDPVLSVTEDMLSELPAWRRDLGLNLMNQITRIIVVSWGRATKHQKEALAAAAPQ